MISKMHLGLQEEYIENRNLQNLIQMFWGTLASQPMHG